MSAEKNTRKKPELSDEEKKRRAIAIAWLSALAVPGIPIAIWLFLVFSAYLTEFIIYLFPTVYYTEVVADVTAEGQRYRLTSTAKCSVWGKVRLGGLIGGPNPKAVEGGLLVKRLPSGAGLLIIGPALCGKRDKINVQKYFTHKRGLQGGWPRVFWFDNAEKPIRIIGYWKEYLTRPDADIQIHNMQYRPKELGWLEWKGLPGPEEELPWLEGRKLRNRHGQRKCQSNPADWVGFYLFVVGEDVWSKVSTYDFLHSKYTLSELEYSEVSISNLRRDAQQHPIQVDPHKMTYYLDELELSRSGRLIYYKKSEFKRTEKFDHIKRIDFLWRNKIFKNNNKWLYDPDRKIIFKPDRDIFGKHRLCR